MAKARKTAKTSQRKRHTVAPPKAVKPGSKSLDRWWNANRQELLRRAEANTVRLTGQPRL